MASRASEPILATKAQRLFILTIAIQAIVVLTFVAITFRFIDERVRLSSTAEYRTVPCYLALFALAEVFELAMAFDALRLRNIIQLIGILLFHCALIVMAALQIDQTRTALVKFTTAECEEQWRYANCGGPGSLWARVRPLLIVVPCIIGASWLLMLFFVKKLYEEFGWTVFRVVGANPKMKKMYQFYQVMICLLKFDFFFFVGVTMQLLIIVLQKDSAEFAVTVVAIPVVLILLLGCSWALSREVKWLMTASLILMLAAMSYFLYKLVRFFAPGSRERYNTTRGTLTIFTIVAFILLFSTFVIGLRCFADFDRGLASSKINDAPKRPKFGGPAYSTGSASEKHSSYNNGTALTPRISIE